MRQCPRCRTGNSDNARFCSGCGAPLPTVEWAGKSVSQKKPSFFASTGGKVLLGIAAAAVVFVVVVIIAAAVGSGKATTTTQASSETASAEASGAITAPSVTATTSKVMTTTSKVMTTTSKVTQKAGTRENPIPLLSPASVGAWTITVTAVDFDAWDVVEQENMFNDPPAEGNVYVLVSLDASYAGDESGTFWVDISTKFLGNKGNTFREAYAVAPNEISDSGEVFPGASVSGTVLFEVPAEQLQGGMLLAEETWNWGDTRTFFAIE